MNPFYTLFNVSMRIRVHTGECPVSSILGNERIAAEVTAESRNSIVLCYSSSIISRGVASTSFRKATTNSPTQIKWLGVSSLTITPTITVTIKTISLGESNLNIKKASYMGILK